MSETTTDRLTNPARNSLRQRMARAAAAEFGPFRTGGGDGPDWYAVIDVLLPIICSKPLPEQSRRTLARLVADGSTWLHIRDYDKHCLDALERRGLVEMDRYMGHIRTTDEGRRLLGRAS